MPQCSFCKNQYEFPRGTTFVLANGDLLYFCSSKCQKNNKLGRISKKVNWVRKEKKVAGASKAVKTEVAKVSEIPKK